VDVDKVDVGHQAVRHYRRFDDRANGDIGAGVEAAGERRIRNQYVLVDRQAIKGLDQYGKPHGRVR